MKRNNKDNITTIIHELKISYAKIYKEKFDISNKKLETVLNIAAKEYKSGAEVNWIKNDSQKGVEINGKIHFF